MYYVALYKGDFLVLRFVSFIRRCPLFGASFLGGSTVHGFWPESKKFDSGKKGHHRKEHLKESIITQISAP